MSAWETEDEYVAAAAAASLPTPMDTPYRTPSRSSRRTSRQFSSVSPGPSSSPPPMPNGNDQRRNSKDIANDESISLLDPRRFTPSLHANLVSEILQLRRDQEDKAKCIEDLEAQLHESRGAQESLEESLLSTAKENRSLKRQHDLLEGGTSSALAELAKERDDALESVHESKRRWDTAQKKIRSQEEDSDRTHQLWAKDKDNWAEEKRKLERKLHVAEGRLKTVLDDYAQFQAATQATHDPNPLEEERRGHESDAGSVRAMSMTNSIRFSLMNNPEHVSSVAATTLADELNQDEDDQSDLESRASLPSPRHQRNRSFESFMARKHHRNPSVESLQRPMSSRGRYTHALAEPAEADIQELDEQKPIYLESAAQTAAPMLCFSPVVSVDVEPVPANGHRYIADHQHSRDGEVEANQRKKRVHVSQPLILEALIKSSMVSAASQTLADPLSPPRTPISPVRDIPFPSASRTSVATQTEDRSPAPKRAPPPPPIAIPSIQLHPPQSAPATPRLPLLPQHLKDAACQVSMQMDRPTRSISIQTEEIRVDSRINLLPRHLQPSSISSQPPSPEPNLDEQNRFSPIPGSLPPRNPRRISGNMRRNLDHEIPSSPPADGSGYLNDDGPLAPGKSLRRPPRASSLFAGFENASSDDADDFNDADMSDGDYKTALSAPRPKSHAPKSSKRMSAPPTPLLEESEHSDSNPKSAPATAPASAVEAPSRQIDKPLSIVTTAKQGTMRRAALISSGVAAHQGRARSPSLPDGTQQPPFPIPTRASSRRPPISASSPSDGSWSPTWGRSMRHGRSSSIRKVRSAAALPRMSGMRYRSHNDRSPPPMSPSTDAPESPRLPPMPSHDLVTPQPSHRRHRHQPSDRTANTQQTLASTGSNATSVVDAIAQTMVGEWMYKYVRRRKSFGVPEATGIEGENGNGVRHKRWVWLAPYERAVMWSSKQPTSGSALLGKTGRKLLDVKDENPSPKGMPTLFNRSILILTPARALKFTAISAERHYVWLTALSFLVHSSHAVPEVIAVQAAPEPAVPDFEVPRLRRAPIRDSIRVAKRKTVLAGTGPTSVPSSRAASRKGDEGTGGYVENVVILGSAAVPPIVPRLTSNSTYFAGSGPTHSRKRSNTGPRQAPPISFRGFSTSSHGHAPSTAAFSVGTNGSSDVYQSQPGSATATHFATSVSGRSSVRTSDASARPGAVVNNFFDAVGTMRMEAFISPMAGHGHEYAEQVDDQQSYGIPNGAFNARGVRRSVASSSLSRRRNRDSLQSARKVTLHEDWHGGNRLAGEDEDPADPFRGF